MKTIKDLPSPKSKFLIGHLSEFKPDNIHNILESWASKVGDIYKISLLGKQFIVSADPDFNTQILKQRPDKFQRFSKISDVLKEMGIMGVFNAEGESWRKHRKLTSAALNMKNTISYFPIIHDVCYRLFNKLKKLAATGNKIQVQEEMMRFTVDITSTVAFGFPMNTLEGKDEVIQQHLEKIFPMINHRINSLIPFWKVIKSKKDKSLDISLESIKETIKRFINEAKKRLETVPGLKEKSSNFLEALLIEQEKEGSFTDEEIIGNVFTMLLAGEDTTSNSISWTIYYLAQHPQAVERIREEANKIYPNEDLPPNYETLSALKYTEAVVFESMRLKSVSPTLYMQALEQVEINGLQINKGMTLMLQNKVAQTQPQNFVHPNEFLPERWLRGNGCPITGAHNPDVIKVFGAGPRFCPGKMLAMHEIITAVSMICKNFEIKLAVDVKEIKEVFSFTMYPHNLWVNFKSIV